MASLTSVINIAGSEIFEVPTWTSRLAVKCEQIKEVSNALEHSAGGAVIQR